MENRLFFVCCLRCTHVNLCFVEEYPNIVRRKHHVTVHGMRCTDIIETNYVRYDAKTFPDH